jgi:hypothetical protein
VIEAASGTFTVSDTLSLPSTTTADVETGGIENDNWCAVRIDNSEAALVEANRTMNLSSTEATVFDDNGSGNTVQDNVISGTFTA